MMRKLLISLLIPIVATQFPLDILNMLSEINDPMVTAYSEIIKMDTQCFRDIKVLMTDVINAAFAIQNCKSVSCLYEEKLVNASWALKIIAATGRPQSLSPDDASLIWAGDHRLCMNIEGPYETNYCYAHLNMNWKKFGGIFEAWGIELPGGKVPSFDGDDLPGSDRCSALAISNFKLGLCMPASCDRDLDLTRIVKAVTNDSVHLCELSCVGPTKKLDRFFYLINCILIFLLVTAIAASIIESTVTKYEMEDAFRNQTGWELLMSFSLLRNTSDIFSIRKDKDSILCLDAIRFITLTWIINGHAVIFMSDGDNNLRALHALDYFFSDVFINAYAAVDTFFLVSGLLVGYIFFKRAHSNPDFIYTPLNWIMYYAHRWLRLTPAYLLFVVFYVAWTPQLHGVWATGIVQNMTVLVENCERNWWMNALYINNLGDIGQICYPISWFLSADTQLYFAAPLVLIPIFFSWKRGVIAALSGILVTIAVTIAITVYYDLPALGFTLKHPGSNDFMSHYYIKPWVRCIPYLIGILSGYFLFVVRSQQVKIRQPKTWELALYWLISTALALTVIFSVYDYLRGHSEWNLPVRSLYNSIARLAWSVAVAWVVIACTLDWAGPVKALLEHPLWFPLGRLSFCAFLAHWFMLQYFLDLGDRPNHFVSLWHTYLIITLPVCFLSYIMAYLWSCLVEIPLMKIEVILIELMRRHRKVESTTSSVTRSDNIPPGRKHSDSWGITRIQIDDGLR